MKARFTTIVFFMLLAAGNVFGQTWKVDSTYGVNGTFMVHTGGGDYFHDFTTKVLHDGRVMSIYDSYDSLNLRYCVLRRINTDGIADSSFGKYGVLQFQAIDQSDHIEDILELNSGAYLVVQSQYVTKVLNSGIIDSSFGANGSSLIQNRSLVFIDTTDNFYQVFRSVDSFVAVEKHLPNGLYDMNFGVGGRLTNTSSKFTDVIQRKNPGNQSWISNIHYNNRTMFENGDMLFAGSKTLTGNVLFRLKTDGSIDQGFGINGVVINSKAFFPAINKFGNKLLGFVKGGVAQYNSDGSVDSSFARNGVDSIPFYSQMDNGGICLMDNQKMVYAIEQKDSLHSVLVSLRTATGKPDSSFGTNGFLTVRYPEKTNMSSDYFEDIQVSSSENMIFVSSLLAASKRIGNNYYPDTFLLVTRIKLTSPPPPTDSVWPGDADHNGLADNNDLLPIGVAYGLGGPVRTNASIVWHGESCQDWGLQLLNGTNVKHVDCNGDGSINANDTLAIVQNFGLTHAKNEDLPTAWRAGTPGLIIVLSKDTVRAGDTLVASIQLGDATLPVNNIYGLAFTYNYDALVVDTSKTTITYPSSWLASPPERITISKDFKTTGQIKTAVTRINHINRSGFGEVAQVSMIFTTDNINGKDLNYYTNTNFISSLTAIDSIGNPIDLNAGVDSALVEFTPTGIRNTEQFQAAVYPNPASGKLFVKTDGTVLEHVTLRNLLGETVVSEVATGSNKTIDVSGIANGVYILHLETNKGELYRRIVISK